MVARKHRNPSLPTYEASRCRPLAVARLISLLFATSSCDLPTYLGMALACCWLRPSPATFLPAARLP